MEERRLSAGELGGCCGSSGGGGTEARVASISA